MTNMELFSNLKERIRNREIEKTKYQAREFISLADFNGRIYIAYQGNPLVVIDEDLTAADILKQLVEIRDNYVDSKTSEIG